MFNKMLVNRLRASVGDVYQKLFKDTKYFDINDWAHEYPDLVSAGEYTYGSPRIYTYNSDTKLKIGKFCSIAEGSTFLLGGNHSADWITTYPLSTIAGKKKNAPRSIDCRTTKGDICIGNDVWIGYGSIILSGVSVGDGVIVAAGCVVAKSQHLMQNGGVPPYSIIAGNPARIIGYRFSQDVIETLLRVRWWDWPLDKILDNIHVLCSGDIERFRQLCKAFDISVGMKDDTNI